MYHKELIRTTFSSYVYFSSHVTLKFVMFYRGIQKQRVYSLYIFFGLQLSSVPVSFSNLKNYSLPPPPGHQKILVQPVGGRWYLFP